MQNAAALEKNGELTSIMEAIVAKMAEHYGTNPEDLEVSIFPCIGLDEFCVGEEVVDLFVKRGLGQHVYRHENCAQPHIDLAGAMIEMFERCGVPHDSIETSPYVTANYGFNSLRMAPKNTRAFRLDDLSSYPDIAEPVHAPELHSDEENEKMIRASALNLLVAIRH